MHNFYQAEKFCHTRVQIHVYKVALAWKSTVLHNAREEWEKEVAQKAATIEKQYV